MSIYYRVVTLERALIAGLIVALGGIGGIIWSVAVWKTNDFGSLDYEAMMRRIVPSCVALVIGVQAIFGAFLASIIDLAFRPKN